MCSKIIKPLLFKVLFLFSFSLNAQSVEDFISFRNNIKIDDFISCMQEMNWHLYDEDEQRKNDILVYTFKQNNDLNSMMDIQWINYVYRPRHISKNRLSFQVQSINLYEKYIIEILELGFSLELEKVFDNHTMFVYSNKIEKIEVITSQNKYLYDGTKYYNFAFYNSTEYDAVFIEENDKYSKKASPELDVATINYFK
jgi:hypothetical protein